jgi:hypothetical protein
MKIIGVAGKKRSGKDTLADRLEEHGYEKYGFADNIKRACEEIFDFSDEELWGDKKEEINEYWGFTPRHALQVFGTDLFRDKFGDDIWIRSLFRDLQNDDPDKVVITDVRFPNEVEAIQKSGGIVVWIDASERLSESDDHESETALDDYLGFDYTISNNGTKQQFRKKVSWFIQQVRHAFGTTDDSSGLGAEQKSQTSV